MSPRGGPPLRKIQQLQGKHAALTLGELSGPLLRRIETIWGKLATTQVVLTAERRTHYLERHEEVAEFENALVSSVFGPDEIHRNRYDGRMAIFYSELYEGHFLRVALWLSDSLTLKNSIHSVRVAALEELEIGRTQGRGIWRRRS